MTFYKLNTDMGNVVNPTFQPTNKQEESGACSNYPERGGR